MEADRRKRVAYLLQFIELWESGARIGLVISAALVAVCCFKATSIAPIFVAIMFFSYFGEISVTFATGNHRHALLKGCLLGPVGIVLAICAFARLYQLVGINAPEGHGKLTYADCVYFSGITWTTVGYGDFTPNRESQLFAVVEAIEGYFVMAFVFAIVNIAFFDIMRKHYETKVAELRNETE